ncbi:MAG: ABC transporter ATP-binding protein/permease [Bacteroidales bacterium]|nr:ABC transporter ATP-binding protein/permease [Bacteroidales bacterium]
MNESLPPLSSLRMLLRWLWNSWRGYRLQAILNTVIGLLGVAFDLAFVWLVKVSIDTATRVDNRMTLTVSISLLVLTAMLQVGSGLLSRWIKATLGVRAQNAMQRAFFFRLLGSEWRGLRQFHSGDLLNRIERDVSDVVVFLTESLPSLITTIAQFVGAFCVLFLMHKRLAIIVIVVTPIFLLLSKIYMHRMRGLSHNVRNTESRIQSTIQEGLQHSLVLKTLERVSYVTHRLSLLQRELRQHVVVRTRYAIFSAGIMNFGFAAGFLLAFVWGIDDLRFGLITYGTLIAFVQLVSQIQGPVRTLTRFVPVFIGAFTATERLMELEKIPLERRGHRQTIQGQVGIRLENVSFRYTPTSRLILDRFHYTFAPNTVTAIMGETGAGKTTLIRLLLALVRPTEGKAELFNDAGETVSITSLSRCNFSYVPQGNTLVSGTIRDNLLLGNPSATEAEMYEALRLASATFVERLPDGLDARCGEQGDGLSEGQAQRLSIARALLRRSPILLLDEATSALDMETEATVIRNIMSQQKGRTLIFITHRPEVLKYCTHTLRLQ